MPKLLCAHCNREYNVYKNGVHVVEMMWSADRPEPYKVWSADVWYCPVCTTTIVAWFAQEPLITAHDDRINEYISNVKRAAGTWLFYDFESNEQRLAGLKLGLRDKVPAGLPKTVVGAERDAVASFE